MSTIYNEETYFRIRIYAVKGEQNNASKQKMEILGYTKQNINLFKHYYKTW